MRIRPFKPSDARRISYLIRKTLRESNSRDYSPATIDFLVRRYSPANLLRMSTTRRIFVVELGSRLVATGSLDGSEILSFFVNPRYHRRGIGRRLLAHLEALATRAGHDQVFLNSSITALPFYRALGYRKARRQPPDSDHGVLRMSKSLPL